jgi:hypothetical protein
MSTIDSHTIEARAGEYGGGEEFVVYGWGVYGRESVLEGSERKVFEDAFPTLAEAQAAFPEAQVLEFPSGPAQGGMSDCAPSWFDPGACGEVWSEEDY